MALLGPRGGLLAARRPAPGLLRTAAALWCVAFLAMGPAPQHGAPVNGCNVVVGVHDVDDVFARGLELGGSPELAPEGMTGVGRVGYLCDPDGNLFGLISEVLSDGTNVMEQGGMSPPA